MGVNMDEKTRKLTMKALIDLMKMMAAIVTSTAVVGGAVIWFTLPRITEWVADVSRSTVDQYVAQSDSNAVVLAKVSAQLQTLVSRMDQLQSDPSTLRERPLVFEEWGNDITNGAPGTRVSLTWRFKKIHECGAPKVNVFFRNGGDVTHRFTGVSIVSADGEGVNYPVDRSRVQTLTYSALIPGDEEVMPGRASGWVTLKYDQCPWAPPSISPEVPFRILGPEE